MKPGTEVLAYDSRQNTPGLYGWEAMKRCYREAVVLRTYSDSCDMTLVDIRFQDGKVSRGHLLTTLKKPNKNV